MTLAPRVDARQIARDHGIQTTYLYSHVINGFAGRIPELARTGLLKDARIVRIDPDLAVSADDETQPAPPWGLDRIDQRTPSLDGQYAFSATGENVTAYIVDTGIRYSHRDFGGRARFGFDAFGGNGWDCQGHGTHVAGTVGGTLYGVAKQVSLVAVRVLDCGGGGTSSTVIAGLDWILANLTLPAVANLSLSGGIDAVMDDAIRRVVAAGVAVSVSAGNKSWSACSFSPARVAEAMTVGATDAADAPASFTNYGTCVDWYAPGVSVISAGSVNDSATAVKSGTSMAAPHTAGVAALYLERNPAATPGQVASALAEWTTKRIVRFSGSDRGDLLYAGDVTSPNPGNLSPVAQFSSACDGLTCTFTDESGDPDGSIASWAWSFGDQTTSSLRHPPHSYDSAGTYRVTLTVQDNSGATVSVSRDVVVAQDPSTNLPPAVNFSATCLRLACEFQDVSLDPDGTITVWEWSFGDGASAIETAAANPTHQFSAGGVYRVTLTVTDNAGAQSTATKELPVGVILSLAGRKVKGKSFVDLAWKGAESGTVAIFLNGVLLSTVPNTGGFTYQSAKPGQSVLRFKVCEVEMANPVCSLEHTASTQ